MKIIDLTHTLCEDIPTWDGSCGFELATIKDYKDFTGPDLFRVQKITCGAGNFTETQTLEVGGEPHTVVAADFNHDGHLDLADTNRADGTVTCLLGDGRGNFTVSSTTSVLSPNE